MELKSVILQFFPKTKLSKHNKTLLKINVLNVSDELNEILSWPPNIFIILYSIIESTDKYRLIVSHQHGSFWKSKNRADAICVKNDLESLCEAIYNSIFSTNSTKSPTPYLDKRLAIIFSKKNLNTCIYDLFEKQQFVDAAFELLIAIDELFSNIDLFRPNSKLDLILEIRNLFGLSHDNIANNNGKLGVITLKSTTPQTGLNMNNLTHNLTFIKPSVKPKFALNPYKKNTKSNKYNILLLPWPLEIEPSSFSEVLTSNNYDMDKYFGFFNYTPKDEVKISKFLNTLLSAIKRVGNIDIIVLPESALNERTYTRITETLYELYKEKAPMLLAGLYGNQGETSKNVAKVSYISVGDKYTSFEQNKHHRWFLEKNQLRNYNLASALDPDRKWWEHISVGRRNLINLLRSDGLKLCPLICEDLARQEPVAQAVRSIGPNLVISLLLDGPQISSRWPGKYAAVLADDPGSSVLSLTALGMTIRSTGLGFSPSRGVALWSEPGKGSETLFLDEDTVGLVLELEMNREKMWSLDGREKTKPVLRKIIHTSVKMEYSDTNNVSYLKEQVRKELENVLKW